MSTAGDCTEINDHDDDGDDCNTGDKPRLQSPPLFNVDPAELVDNRSNPGDKDIFKR